MRVQLDKCEHYLLLSSALYEETGMQARERQTKLSKAANAPYCGKSGRNSIVAYQNNPDF